MHTGISTAHRNVLVWASGVADEGLHRFTSPAEAATWVRWRFLGPAEQDRPRRAPSLVACARHSNSPNRREQPATACASRHDRNDVLSTTAMWSAAEHEDEAGRQMVPTRRFQGRVTCSRPLMNTHCVVTWSAANTFHQFLMLGRMPGALGVLVGSPAFQSTLPQIWFHVLAVHAFKPKIRLAADCSTCIKVVLLGSSASGAKTSFIARFVNGTFATNPNATICANFTTKQVATCKWQLWDTAGQERFRCITPMYYRRSVAAVVGYDITCRDSLAVAKSWLQELAEKSPDTHIALVGNKADLADRRSVSEVEGSNLARKYGCAVFKETSALTGLNVRETFDALLQAVAADAE